MGGTKKEGREKIIKRGEQKKREKEKKEAREGEKTEPRKIKGEGKIRRGATIRRKVEKKGREKKERGMK